MTITLTFNCPLTNLRVRKPSDPTSHFYAPLILSLWAGWHPDGCSLTSTHDPDAAVAHGIPDTGAADVGLIGLETY